ncbi:hypothetical protein L596_004986 [Steinernema carpocapsae]|uniref:Uncharacterized protein n=1 Tax=Steinernema carpocapsae TaxID=34508 RepID=A0A4U8UXK0_STECR|nr:hypothetical protein L596_004986 [Steinernema carpocapsae]
MFQIMLIRLALLITTQILLVPAFDVDDELKLDFSAPLLQDVPNTVPAVTHWEDEEEMRARLKQYTAEKFSHGYHLRNDSSAVDATTELLEEVIKNSVEETPRAKRDGGVLSGPIVGAVVSGMIGMTARAVSDLTAYRPFSSDGGCKWFGTAPLCNYPCPPEYDYIRRHNGRCSNMWFTSFCVPDPSFGEPCSTVFGKVFTKRYCCKSDPQECSWSGRWMGANTAHNIYCRYDNDVGRCGMLSCSINHYTYQGYNSTVIGGERCDQLDLFDLKGKATCGYIAWFDNQGELVNSWYKTS